MCLPHSHSHHSHARPPNCLQHQVCSVPTHKRVNFKNTPQSRVAPGRVLAYLGLLTSTTEKTHSSDPIIPPCTLSVTSHHSQEKSSIVGLSQLCRLMSAATCVPSGHPVSPPDLSCPSLHDVPPQGSAQAVPHLINF